MKYLKIYLLFVGVKFFLALMGCSTTGYSQGQFIPINPNASSGLGFIYKTTYDSIVEANKVGASHKTVYRLADLPTAVSGTITLEDNAAYNIVGGVDISPNVIIAGIKNTFYGNDKQNDFITSNSTGTLITLNSDAVNNTSLAIVNMSLKCVNGTIFKVTSTAQRNVLILDNCNINGCTNIGSLNNVTSFVTRNCAFLLVTGSGITTTGVNGILQIRDGQCRGIPGIFLNLGTSTFNTIQIGRNLIAPTPGNTFISGLAGGANVVIAGAINNNIFSGGGTYINTILPTDAKWSFTDNSGIPNTPTTLSAAYTRTVSTTGMVLYTDSASTTSGVATFFPTSNGLVGGSALFTSIYSVQATARFSATTAISTPFCSIKSISSDRKTITVNAIKGFR